MQFKNALVLVSLLALGASLGGCSTFEGLKDDLSSGYDAVANSFTSAPNPIKEGKKTLPVYDGTCPQVSVRPDLKHLAEFYDDSKPSENTRLSEITIASVTNTCRTEKDNLVMQIDLTLDGKTGPKARQQPTDKPSFAYPYFIAVTDPQGNVLSKEIFAASVSYAADQKEVHQTETVFQNMPFPDASIGQSYSVIIGFQLTEEQLAYNQKNPADAAPAPVMTPLVMKPSTATATKSSIAKSTAKPTNN